MVGNGHRGITSTRPCICSIARFYAIGQQEWSWPACCTGTECRSRADTLREHGGLLVFRRGLEYFSQRRKLRCQRDGKNSFLFMVYSFPKRGCSWTMKETHQCIAD